MSQRGRVHIYCRVSSSGQEDGYSLDTQEAACRTWAEQRGYAVASVAREVFSSGELHRPQLDAMIAGLARGDIFLAYRPDRLSRHQKHPHILEWMIEERGARLAYVTQEAAQTEEEVLLGNVTNYTSAAERAKIREQTQRGRRARVAAGKPIAGPRPAYGYVWNADKSRYLLDPETAPVVRLIFDWALDGATLRGIVARLHERGILSPTGKQYWTPTVLRHLLLRHVYTGDAMAYAKRADRRPGGGYTRRSGTPEELVPLPGVAEPIITHEEHAVVVNRLTMNKAHAARNNRDPEAALLRAGFAVCGHCGWHLGVSNPASSASPGESARYHCDQRARQAHGCPFPTISASLVDGPVWDRVCAVLRNPAMIERELAKHRSGGGLDRELGALDKRIADNASKQATLAQTLARLDDPSPVIAQLNALSAGKKALEDQRADLIRRIADTEADRARVRSLTEWCGHVAAKLETATYAEKRMALEALGVKVRIYRAGTLDEAGNPNPRWVAEMRPIGSGEPIMYPPSDWGSWADSRRRGSR